MEDRINVAELLKDCPRGMELDCTMYNNVTLSSVDFTNILPIRIVTKSGFSTGLTKYGQNITNEDAKCVIFPKGKTTWEGFVPPCKFNDGDILTNKHGKPFILKAYLPTIDNVWSYCGIDMSDTFWTSSNNWTYARSVRFATEEEKAILFKAIKDNGYKWNADEKKLEKLIEPKFKVGDRIKKGEKNAIVERVYKNIYDIRFDIDGGIGAFTIDLQDEWELVPNKFDITTLNPYDRVLVRHNKDNKWCASFFSHIDGDFQSHCYKFVTIAGKSYPKMIPYEENKYLRGTTDDCDEYYKTW